MPEVKAPQLGRVLALARQAKGLAQHQVAAPLNTTQATISAWERGKLRPNLEQLVALARVLGADRLALLDAVESEIADELPAELPSRVKGDLVE